MACNCLGAVQHSPMFYHNGTTWVGLLSNTGNVVPSGTHKFYFTAKYHCDSSAICTCRALYNVLWVDFNTPPGSGLEFTSKYCIYLNGYCANNDVNSTQYFELPPMPAGYGTTVKIDVYDGNTPCPVPEGSGTVLKSMMYSMNAP